MSRKIPLLLMLGLFMLLGVGCCPMTKLNISIQLDKSFQDKYSTGRQITVDVVGVKDSELDLWTNYPMSKYWNQGDSLRQTPMVKTLTFNSSSLDPQTISASDPIWDKWMDGASDKHPPHIFVLVQLPGTARAEDDKPGAQDARRQILSTSSCQNAGGGAFKGPPNIHLVVLADRLSQQ